MDFKPLEYLYIPSGKDGAQTLLLLHGTGGDERDLLPLTKNLGDGFNVLSVRGNVLENGMPRFFKRIGMGVFDEHDLEFRSAELIDFLEKISIEKGFDISKIIALGYSNGANIAGAILMLKPDFLSGAILFRPMKPFRDKAFAANETHTPIFISSGKNDPTVRPDDTRVFSDSLKKAGFAVDHFEMDSGHNLTQEDLNLAAVWFNRNYRDLLVN